MNAGDKQVLRVVSEDLEFIKDSWGDAVDDPFLRRGSTTLRVLLVDDGYGRAWRLAGLEKQPSIVAPDLTASLRGIDLGKIGYAQAGGALFQGARVALMAQFNFALSEQQIKERSKLGLYALERTYSLDKFKESVCVISDGVKIRRIDVIKYVAERLGGAHINTKRESDNPRDYMAIALDRATLNLTNDKPSIYYEILSMGQAIGRAPDTQRFIQRARDLLDAV